MRRYIVIIVTGFLLCGLPACFYSDSETYFVEPIPGDPPLVSISTSLDTLYNPPVNDSLQVSYLVEISGGEFYYIFADVANTLVYESDSTEGSFWINRSLADSPGIDTLHMEFYYSSNSNTLGDKVGYEALNEKLSFAVDFNLEGR